MKRVFSILAAVGMFAPVAAQGQWLGTTPRVYYYTQDLKVWELSWTATDNTWRARNISQDAVAPNTYKPGFLMAGFGVGPNLDPRVYYPSFTQRQRLDVQELSYRKSDNTRHVRNISQEANAPEVFDPRLVGFAAGANRRKARVYYRDVQNHIQELRYRVSDDTWHHRDISLEVDTSAIAGCSAAFGVGANLDPRLYCTTGAGHVQEFAWFDKKWHARDISAETNASSVYVSDYVAGFAVGANLSPRVYYPDTNYKLQELWYRATDNTWHVRHISKETNAPVFRSLLVGFGIGSGLSPSVYYEDDQSRFEQLWWRRIDNTWHLQAVSRPNTVPVFSSAAGTAVGVNLDPRIYYLDANDQVQELAGSSSDAFSWQMRAVGKEAGGAPAIGRLLSFSVGGQK